MDIAELLADIIETELTKTEIKHLKTFYEKVLLNPKYSGKPTIDDLKDAIELL